MTPPDVPTRPPQVRTGSPAGAPGPAPTGPRVVLVGPPGAGKSTVARSLAAQLGVTVRDTDADVEAVAGKPIREIFVDDGEPHFRALERAAVVRALEEHSGVLALGGGAVMDPLTEAALAAHAARGGVVVFLDVSLAHAAPRVGLNQARPLLVGNPRSQWQALMERRRPVYERVATLVVSTDGRTAGQVARTIAGRLAGAAGDGASGATSAGTGGSAGRHATSGSGTGTGSGTGSGASEAHGAGEGAR